MIAPITYADILRPKARNQQMVYDLFLVFAGSILIALSAQVSLNLSFSPVPITGQTFAVLMLGALYGKHRGLATVLAYLGEGAIGMPVFAGGTGGVAVIAGPTGGYLIGFAVAAYVVGWLSERGWDRNTFLTIFAMVIGNALIYLFGVSYLSTFPGVEGAIAGGLIPFLVGDVLKILLAASLLPTGWWLLNRSSDKTEQ